MLKLNYIKNVLKLSGIILILLQLSCAQSKKKENIIGARAGKIESLDPAQANTLRTLQILSALGDTLYKINKEGNLSPNLAKALPKVSQDGLVIDIPLKENISFHDGSIFNAKAMKFSLDRFMKIGTLNYLLNDKNSYRFGDTCLIDISKTGDPLGLSGHSLTQHFS